MSKEVPTIEDLFDRQAIVDVCNRVAFATDSCDWVQFRTCFTDDAVISYGDWGVSEGYAAIEDTNRSHIEPLAARQHMLTNHFVTIEDDEAECTSYFQFSAQGMHKGPVEGSHYLVVSGRYVDRLLRAEDGWRIFRRDMTVLLSQGNPAIV